MSNHDPDQLRLDIGIDQGDPGSIESPKEKEVFYLHPLTGKHISERQIDNYAKTRPCSDNEAFVHFGVKPEHRIVDGELASTTEQKKYTKIVIANNLGERALHLLRAVNDYQKSNTAGRLVHDLYTKGDEEASDAALANQVIFECEGDQEFYRSWYAGGLKKRKQDTISERQAAKEGQADFFDLSTNPDRTDELAVFLETLKDKSVSNKE